MQKEHEQAAQAILNEISASKSGSSGTSTPTVISSGNGKLGLPCYAGATVTSEFGSRILRGQPNYHTGIDFAVSTGTPVLAAADGVVLASGWRGSYGNCVTIDHGDMVTLYAHNSALNVTAGQKVVRGQQIAAAGSTGNSTGPHIHFSVIINGQYVNPRPYLW
jgi:murein DD-endopeptidase MepM/ murein hydrolase activator NlpD